MDWNLGYSAAYYVMKVDKNTWRDIERMEITGGSINRSKDDLRCSASFDCLDYERGTENWIRIYMDARQGDESVHIPLFTGIATSPGEKINGNIVENSVDCYSVLKPAEDVLLDRGWYAPAEISGASLVRQLLSVTPAPVVEDEGAPSLKEAIIAEDGESNLSMIDKILTAINWRILIEGDGTIHITSKAIEPSEDFDALSNDSIELEIDVEQDWFSCPNVFRAVADDLSGVARDDSDRSMLSTVNRGREVWMEESNCDLNDGETIAEYALRRLKEEQKVAMTVKYDRRFNPNIFVTDIVRLHYPKQGLEGLYEVQSQSISLGYGGRTSEEVVKIGRAHV